MYVSKSSIRLGEFTETSLGMANDLRLLARDASGGPGSDVGCDGVPYILLLQELYGRLSGGWDRP